MQKKIAQEKRPERLPKGDWNFSTVPIWEAEAACIWEYARESESLRKGTKYRLGNYHEAEKAAVIDNLNWFWKHVPELCFKRSWAEARGELRDRTGMDPVQRSAVVRKVTKVLGVVQEDYFGNFALHLEIDTRAERQCLEREFCKIVTQNRPPANFRVTAQGKDKTRWADYLCWLAVLRLSQCNTAMSGEATRCLEGRSPQTLSRQRSKAIEVFGKLFWFLPTADHLRVSEHYKK
jgi:hypothetical protein